MVLQSTSISREKIQKIQRIQEKQFIYEVCPKPFLSFKKIYRTVN